MILLVVLQVYTIAVLYSFILLILFGTRKQCQTRAFWSLSVCTTFTRTFDAARAVPWSRRETCRVCLHTTSLGMPTTRCRTFMVTESIKMKPQFELWTKRYPWWLEVARNKCQKIHWNTSRVGLLLPKEDMKCLRLVRNRGWGTGWKLNKVGISEFADLVRQHTWWAQTPGQERVSEPVAKRHTQPSPWRDSPINFTK